MALLGKSVFFFSLAFCFEIVFSLKPPGLINIVAHTVFRTLSIKPMIVFLWVADPSVVSALVQHQFDGPINLRYAPGEYGNL